MKLSHTDNEGKPRMVDVSGKPVQKRTAEATGLIRLDPETSRLIRSDGISKGNVLLTAQISGIQAAKRTPELIPLCHHLELKKIDVDTEMVPEGIRVNSRVICIGQTGAEMEALEAVSTALLTIYDMCKAVDKNMSLEGIRLIAKKKEPIGKNS
jgi:cyclic pyranopterin phosphate synthase